MSTPTKIFTAILIFVLGATVSLFFLFAPEEKEALFYTNMAFTLLGEMALLSGLGLFSHKPKMFNVSNVAFIYILNIFAITVLSATFLFGFYLVPVMLLGIVWYIGTMILITIIFVVLLGVVGIAANSQVDANNSFQAKASVKEDYRALTASLSMHLSNAITNKEFDVRAKEECRLSVQKLADTILNFPILKIDRNPVCYQTIMTELNRISKLIDEIQDNASLRNFTNTVRNSEVRISAMKQ